MREIRKIFLECECIDNDVILKLEEMPEIEGVIVSLYIKKGYWFWRHRKLLNEIILGDDQINELREWLEKSLIREEINEIIIGDLIYHLENVSPINPKWLVERLRMMDKLFELKLKEEVKNND